MSKREPQTILKTDERSYSPRATGPANARPNHLAWSVLRLRRGGRLPSLAVEQKYYPPQNGVLPAGQYRLPPRASRCLGYPNGDILLLTYLMEGQEVTVLQLPATGSKAPQRAAYV